MRAVTLEPQKTRLGMQQDQRLLCCGVKLLELGVLVSRSSTGVSALRSMRAAVPHSAP